MKKMSAIVSVILLSMTLSAVAQVINPNPIPYPFPGHTPGCYWPESQTRPWCPDYNPLANCRGQVRENVTALTRVGAEAKAQEFAERKKVSCAVTRVNLDYAEAFCKTDEGKNYARLKMYFGVRCDRTFPSANRSTLRSTTIRYL